MASAKNYTDEMVSTMTEQYSANPTRETVDALAEQFGKQEMCINFQERECIAQPRTTKTGEPVISKSVGYQIHPSELKCLLVKAGKRAYKD